MKRNITILIVDDKNQDAQIQAIKTNLRDFCNLEVIPIITTAEELRQDDNDHLDPNKLRQRIADVIKDRNILYTLTDCNLAEPNFDGFDVVDMLCQQRKNIQIIMYSGDQQSIVKKFITNNSLPHLSIDEIVDIVCKLMSYPIRQYIKREGYKEEIEKLIRQDKNLYIENLFLEQLRTNSTMTFNSCCPKLKGKTFGEVADMIEQKSDNRSEEWEKALVDQTIAYLVDANE